MLKQYLWNGSTWQFEEKLAPKDAVEIVPAEAKPIQVKKAEPKLNKAVKTAKTKTKEVKK